MVTKQEDEARGYVNSLILAKIHMVTKLIRISLYRHICLILAKIHMVTKLNTFQQ